MNWSWLKSVEFSAGRMSSVSNGIETDGWTSPSAPSFFGIVIIQDGLSLASTFDEDFVGLGTVGYCLAFNVEVAGDEDGGGRFGAEGLDAFDFKLIDT